MINENIKNLMADMENDMNLEKMIDELNQQAEEGVKKQWHETRTIRMSFLGMLSCRLVDKIEECVRNENDFEKVREVKELYEFIRMLREDLL